MTKDLSPYDRHMIWQALQTYLEQHSQGEALRHSLLQNPHIISHVVEQWLQTSDAPKPPHFNTLISGQGKIDKVVNIAQAGLVVFQSSSPNISSHEAFGTWNIPYPRNPFFTGRKKILSTIHAMFQNNSARPIALCGLGGVGKTQIALEYCYQNQNEYTTILWINASTQEEYFSQLASAAYLLRIAEREEQDQSLITQMLFAWLNTHTNWLLIINNADNLDVIQGTFPPAGKGHVLLTTRADTLKRLAEPFSVREMEPEEGKDFLLHRVDLPKEDTQTLANTQKLVALLGALPLALDQAGAYIEETGCLLSDYIDFYHTQRKELLKKRGRINVDYPESVATTWTVSFQQVECSNPVAAQFLRACAFLAPENIPEYLFLQQEHLDLSLIPLFPDDFHLTEIFRILLSYSLVRRQRADRTFSLHRLVQVVMKDELSQDKYQEWAEQIVPLLAHHFPWSDIKTREQCSTLLPHALESVDLIEQNNIFSFQAATLLQKTQNYVSDQGQYKAAERLCQLALTIDEQMLGPDHPDTANSLNNLANTYKSQGKYDLAELLYQYALTIDEQVLGPDHPDTVSILNNLASLYCSQSKYDLAEPLFQYALAIRETVLGPDHPDTADSLNNLASLYCTQNKYDLAEPLHQRALAIRAQVLGPDHPRTADSLNNLALLYCALSKYDLAEPLHQRALIIHEHVLGPDHPETAISLTNLASLYCSQNKYNLAEPLFQRALAIRETMLGPDHPYTADSLYNLALLYEFQDKYDKET